MTYSYQCTACENFFSAQLSIARRDEPLAAPCPACHEKLTVVRSIETPSISYDIGKSPIRRAGTNWNDLLKKMAAPCGRHSKIQVE